MPFFEESLSNNKSINNQSSILNENNCKKSCDDMPLSFASFYYSLKVLKGKGINFMNNWI